MSGCLFLVFCRQSPQAQAQRLSSFDMVRQPLVEAPTLGGASDSAAQHKR